MRQSSSLPEVYLYRDPIDFRKSFKGLAVLVEQELGHNPFDGHLYAFTNRHRNKIKCLFWEDSSYRGALCFITRAWRRISSTGQSPMMNC
ncbi:IS66 family insertion sequence element accessory protein TnpB [Endozoicomonas ascidiicola]|uniref:IS66 family insertion sequence element accessory protein TnpB n=1 Tax=Endozoicomonas ascidiicola TaxID=1698521 RepID=UPI000AB8A264|nr:IS66 family insertion sequence element accessory protein TnpB [Endozoicomonas ascidiicola]